MKPFFNQILSYRTFLVFNFLIFTAKMVYSFVADFPGKKIEDWYIGVNFYKYHVYAEFVELGPTAYKLPVYPLLISFFNFIFSGVAREALIIFQHFLYFLIPVLFFKICGLFKKEKAGIIAGYFFIFSPAYFMYSNIIEVTNIFIFIFLVWLFYYSKIFLGKGIRNLYFILFGLLTALLFLTQVIVIPFCILLIIFLVVYKKIKFSKFLIIGACIVLGYSPWVIRNYLAFDRIILSKTPVWQNIHSGFYEEHNIIPELKLISIKEMNEKLEMRSKVNELVMEEVYKKEIKEKLGTDWKLKFTKKAFQNLFFLWYVPPRYFYDQSFEIFWGRKVYSIILNILTLFSLIGLRKNKLLFYGSVLLFVNFSLPYMIGHAANTRFKLDFEWFQFILIGLFFLKKLSVNFFKNLQ